MFTVIRNVECRRGKRRLPASSPGRIGLWAGASLLLLLPLAAAADADFERRLDASPHGRVEISNIAGSVEVRGWDRAEVEITGRLGPGIEEVEVRSRGDRIEIEVKNEHSWFGSGGSAELEIRVPAGSRVGVETVSADISLAAVLGEVELESVSGDIEVKDRPESIAAESVSGDIEIRDGATQMTAETVSGTVEVAGRVRDLEASSVSGSVFLVDVEDLERVEVESVNGKVRIEASLAGAARLEASSHSGSVTLILPASTSARISATTFSGDILNELGPPARRRDRSAPGEELDFTLGRGEARIEIESFSGSITLRSR